MPLGTDERPPCPECAARRPDRTTIEDVHKIGAEELGAYEPRSPSGVRFAIQWRS